ncbi:CNNM domain-containing protein [Flaviflexus huanghaiensis]|uniref:CNNM domain-containing protein n=1 Tax=Flaviflexus huanghaiensis TaxID=1111473 RepID=UPI0015FCD1C0
MSAAVALTIGAILLALNAFFVGAEFAIMSARRSRIEPLADAGSKPAQTVLWALENVTLMLAACQLGITLCSTSLGAVAEPAIAQLLMGPFTAVGLPSAASHAVAFAVALIVVVYLHVVVGEMVPKNLAVTAPEKAALILAPPLVIIARIFKPIVVGLNKLANQFVRLAGFEPKDEVASGFTADEVASIVETSQRAGVLEDEIGLIAGALEFSDLTVAEVMVPRDDVATVGPDVTPAELEERVAKTGFSRFVVADETGHFIGYLHLKDVIGSVGAARHRPLPAFKIRTMSSMPGDDEVESALAIMKRDGIHLVEVRNSDGASVGVLFLEDVLEELVGEVRDSMQRDA